MTDTSEMDVIAVIGAGFMGSVIATIYKQSGYDVVLCDNNPEQLDSFAERIKPIADAMVWPDQHSTEQLHRIKRTTSITEAVSQAFLVHEAIQENLPAKQSLFTQLDKLCDPKIILATNTSSYLLTEICRNVRYKERVIGIHFVTPAHIIKTVEIIHASFTPETLISRTRNFIETLDHIGVACRERPGFLVNSLQYALLAEAYRLVDSGFATIEDIDAAIRLSIGPRLALWGPLMTEDLVASKSTALAVMEYLQEQAETSGFMSSETLKGLVAEGRQGAISGHGWYEWTLPYHAIVAKRDKQLADIMEWLTCQNAAETIGAADREDLA